jgi:hypothetical protein
MATKTKRAGVADNAEYGDGNGGGYPCEHCGVTVVWGYDGRSDKSWSHIYGDGRDGTQDCGRRLLTDARDATGCFCPGDCGCQSAYRATVCGCTGKHGA